MKSINTLNPSSIVAIVEICRNCLSDHYRDRLQSVVLYGSAARQEMTADSDIDLLVEFSVPVGMFEFLDLKEYLESILKVQVDLATESALKKQLKAQILKEAVRAA